MAQALNSIYVDCIAATRVDREAVRRWLDQMGATDFEIPSEEAVSDPALLVALAAKQCYMSFQPGLNPNVSKVRSDLVEYLDNVLSQGHGSVTEHATFTFAVDGCSRVFTGEMNRHRAGAAISERSMRFVRYENIRYWLPECFRVLPEDSDELAMKKIQSQDALHLAFSHQEEMMRTFNNIWANELTPTSTFHLKKVLTSAFRRGIGMGIATGGVWTLNMRAMRHIVASRTDPAAEEEIVNVVGQMARIAVSRVPELFGDFMIQGKQYIPGYKKV